MMLPHRPLRGLRAPLVLATLALLLGACNDEAGASAPPADTEPVTEVDVDREIRDLITALTPLDTTANKIESYSWAPRRKETLERMRTGSHELGLAALEAYRSRGGAIAAVRSGLLDVAAHCAPEETLPVLEELVTTYGDDLGVRKSAALTMARTSPERAVEVLEAIIVQTRPKQTYPPMEGLVAAWLEAMERLDRDPTELLTLIATDLKKDAASRHFAARALGNHPSDAGRQGLEILLVESTGNNYLRRVAAQSLAKTLPDEELCPVLERILEREADTVFQSFLLSMMEDHCR
jgi:HEAT repeat protein